MFDVGIKIDFFFFLSFLEACAVLLFINYSDNNTNNFFMLSTMEWETVPMPF